MGEKTVVEVQDPLTFRVVYDEEVDFLYANIPIKATPGAVRKIVKLTGDSWRYMEDKGLVLILSAWASESGMDMQAVGKALEEEYKGLLDEIKKIVEGTGGDEGEEEGGEKKKKKGVKRGKKTKKKTKRSKKRKGAKKKGKKGKETVSGKSRR